jgi:hypothetical protein
MPLDAALYSINLGHNLAPYFSKIHFNIHTYACVSQTLYFLEVY